MGREVRRVPPDWKHPRDFEGNFIPLFEGDSSQEEKEDYMPNWPDSERTHIQMYETCTEGTPISPVMRYPEELAKWLADNRASSFGSSTATYGQWLAMIKGPGFAVSAVMDDKGLRSGVEAMAELTDKETLHQN